MLRTNPAPRPPRHDSRFGRTIAGVFPALGLLGVTAALVFMAPTHSPQGRSIRVVNAATTTTEVSAVPGRADLHSALARLNFDPESLAAAGVGSGDMPALVAAVAVRIGAPTPTLMELDASFRTTNARFEELKRLAQGGRATSEELSEYAAVAADLASINESRESILAQARTSALAAVTGEQAAALDQLAAAASVAVPTEYRLAALDAAGDQDLWVRLRDALAQQRYCQEHDETLDPSSQNAIGTIASAESITAARSNLTNNLAAVASAWSTAMSAYE